MLLLCVSMGFNAQSSEVKASRRQPHDDGPAMSPKSQPDAPPAATNPGVNLAGSQVGIGV